MGFLPSPPPEDVLCLKKYLKRGRGKVRKEYGKMERKIVSERKKREKESREL